MLTSGVKSRLFAGPDQRLRPTWRAALYFLIGTWVVLPLLDGLMSTLMGWRTTQPGLNPLRPDVFVLALQTVLKAHIPDAPVREAMVAPDFRARP